MSSQHIRLFGLLKLIAGSAAFALGFWFIMNYGEQVETHRGPVGPAIAAGLPGIFALIGLVEICSGEKISEISERWNDMNVWKQRLIGALILCLSVGIMAGILIVLAYLRVI